MAEAGYGPCDFKDLLYLLLRCVVGLQIEIGRNQR